jgi:hypothetical protein
MTLGREKTDPQLCQPVGAIPPPEAVFCKVWQLGTLPLTSKKNTEPFKLIKNAEE